MNSFVGQSSKKIGQLFQQANQLHVQGHLDRAREGYLKVLQEQPKHFDALHLLGVLACQAKDYERAVDFISQAIQISANPVFYYSVGVAYQEMKKWEDAENSYLSALKLKPKYPEVLYNLGLIKRVQKDNLQAIAYFDQALKFKADYTDAHYNKGNALKDLCHFEQAVQSFEHAIALNHNYAQAYLNKGMALKELGQFDAALECYANALRVNPAYSDVYSNMGILQTELKRWPEAMRSFQEALNLNPEHAQALWNKSLLLLLHGDFKGGFALYSARWREEVLISPVFKSQKPWAVRSGSLGACGRLLVWSEQGIGDEIMFGSLLSQACSLSKELIVQLDRRLVPLFQRSFPQHVFIPKGEVINEELYDQHMPIGQLAEMFCLNLDAFKAIPTSYLICDPNQRVQIKDKLVSKSNPRPIIGISWRSKNDKKGADRSMSVTDLVGTLSMNIEGGFDTDRFSFVNLQYGATQEEISRVGEMLGAELLSMDEIDNYSDIDGLASLIGACDAVVSIDNSTVHLSGALGKPTFVLLPYSADWRWGLNESQSHWYPSLFLYRQDSAGAWAQPLFKLQSDLLNAMGLRL